MSSLRRRGLQLDDPLGPGPPAGNGDGVANVAVERKPEPREKKRPTKTAGRPAATGQKPARPISRGGDDDRRAWREWSAFTGVGSFRLPQELLTELGDTARELELPIGMLVTAAITQLLDQSPETVTELVDRADDARIQGRRRARRRRTEGAGD